MQGKGLLDSFICHCTDCRKLTASIMGTAAFVVKGSHLRHIRGKDNLTTFSLSKTVETGNTMVSSFCKTCGTLLYRTSTGFPDNYVLRIGTVDDFNLAEGRLKPQFEQFVRDRPSYISGIEGIPQYQGFYWAGKGRKSSSGPKSRL